MIGSHSVGLHLRKFTLLWTLSKVVNYNFYVWTSYYQHLELIADLVAFPHAFLLIHRSWGCVGMGSLACGQPDWFCPASQECGHRRAILSTCCKLRPVCNCCQTRLGKLPFCVLQGRTEACYSCSRCYATLLTLKSHHCWTGIGHSQEPSSHLCSCAVRTHCLSPVPSIPLELRPQVSQ